ncbi:MAG: alkene reductase [Synechococcus sp.]|nr:alkene reductase [Synechococcus sp.]
MTTASPKLLESFDFHGLPLQNRVVMAPMTRARAGKDRIPNELMAEYYAQRASTGLIIAEATTISEQANGWNESPGIYTEAMVEGWKLTTKAVHAQGGKIFLQLWHMGRASHSSFHGGKLPIAPSPIKIDNGDEIHTPIGKQPYEVPRAIETAEIPGIIEEYRQAAIRAKAAGFDGIEIHSANGYLLDTFIQSKTNHRTDAYGGSVENRCRLLLEILDAVTTVWDSHRVGVRFSPNGSFNDMGSPDFRGQFTYAASQLNRYNLAYLHVMDGLAFGFHELGEPLTLKDFRAVYEGVLIGNCGNDKESAAKAIAFAALSLSLVVPLLVILI